MATVPKNKKYYIGAHRFIEGDVIPPHLAVNLPDGFVEPEQVKRGRPKKEAFALTSDIEEQGE